MTKGVMRNISKHHGFYSLYTCSCRSDIASCWIGPTDTKERTIMARNVADSMILLSRCKTTENHLLWSCKHTFVKSSEAKNMCQVAKSNAVTIYYFIVDLTVQEHNLPICCRDICFSCSLISTKWWDEYVGRFSRTSTNSHDKIHVGIFNLNTSMLPSSLQHTESVMQSEPKNISSAITILQKWINKLDCTYIQHLIPRYTTSF